MKIHIISKLFLDSTDLMKKIIRDNQHEILTLIKDVCIDVLKKVRKMLSRGN